MDVAPAASYKLKSYGRPRKAIQTVISARRPATVGSLRKGAVSEIPTRDVKDVAFSQLSVGPGSNCWRSTAAQKQGHNYNHVGRIQVVLSFPFLASAAPRASLLSSSSGPCRLRKEALR